ncbi:MAG: selenoprotein [Rhodospirillales bacterium]|nr:selenoprotein [Rhodospirillales bacterium]
MPISSAYHPSTAHAELGVEFFDPVEPARFPRHLLRHRNQRWAERVGLGALSDEEWNRHFGAFEALPGSFERPLALRYHGHQFRTYNPELGDGRGFLFAQLHDAADGRLLDLGTKGSGQTPWSRHGDGRLTLKGGVREVLATEMLEALGVETSKSFSLIETGESLFRGDEPSPTRSSVLVRLNHSHIRIGTFQRFAYTRRNDEIERLLDHTVRLYLPEAARATVAETAAAFLETVTQRVATMGAQWMAAGFVHGVLNTDNVNVTGESFDYGPWRFLPMLDPAFTAAYFDESGLYSFGRQPDALLWNLVRLAECLLPLAEEAALEAALDRFEPALQRGFAAASLHRLGLRSAGEEQDRALAMTLWRFLAETRLPYEQAWFDLRGGRPADAIYAPLRETLASFEPASDTTHDYFRRQAPCTMLIDEVEAIWAPIAADDDWSRFDAKLADIAVMREAYAGLRSDAESSTTNSNRSTPNPVAATP